jgi:hypothetical protein
VTAGQQTSPSSWGALQQTLATALDALGSTSDEIAAELARRGIRGWREEAGECPIAVYLHAALGSSDPGGCTVTADDVLAAGVHVAPSPAVGEFVIRFDAGAYPHLVDPDDDTHLAEDDQ